MRIDRPTSYEFNETDSYRYLGLLVLVVPSALRWLRIEALILSGVFMNDDFDLYERNCRNNNICPECDGDGCADCEGTGSYYSTWTDSEENDDDDDERDEN